jgi:glycosyltransferase involved in cell wall biosynthesis
VLPQAIESVLEQTFPDFELLVVDDGSTDKTAVLIPQLFPDKRLRLIQHQRNRGVAAARNTGIIASKGAWIAFIDSDDVWQFDKLEKQMNVAESMKAGDTAVIYTALTRHQDNRKTRFPQTGASGLIHTDLIGGNLVAASTALVRRDCFDRDELFDEQLPCLVDWELWLRLSRFYRFYFMDEALVTAYDVGGKVGGEDTAVLHALEHILHKHEASISQDKRLFAQYHYLIGNALCLQGQSKRGRHYLQRAITAASYDPKYRLARAISYLGPHIYTDAQSILNLI